MEEDGRDFITVESAIARINKESDMSEKARTYRLDLVCGNCGNQWCNNIPVGMDFFPCSYGTRRYEACYGKIIMFGREVEYDSRVNIECPNCGSHRVRKADVPLAEDKKGSKHSLGRHLKASNSNPFMHERWRILENSLEEEYTWSLLDTTSSGGNIEGAEEVCAVKGRRGKGLKIVNTMLHIRPLIEAIIRLDNNTEKDVLLFIAAMHEVQDLLVEAGLVE